MNDNDEKKGAPDGGDEDQICITDADRRSMNRRIIRAAMDMESHALDLHSSLVYGSDDEELRNIFVSMADEDEKRFSFLQKLMDTAGGEEEGPYGTEGEMLFRRRVCRIVFRNVGPVLATAHDGDNIEDGESGYGGFRYNGTDYNLRVCKESNGSNAIKLIRGDGRIIMDTGKGPADIVVKKAREAWEAYLRNDDTIPACVKRTVAVAGGHMDREIPVRLDADTVAVFEIIDDYNERRIRTYRCNFLHGARKMHGSIAVVAKDRHSTAAMFYVLYEELHKGEAISSHVPEELPIDTFFFEYAAGQGWKEFLKKDKKKTAAVRAGTGRKGKGDGNE